ncbi:MAG: hypothetical protein AAB692_02730, partial [Patescibacteria group bacterium]
FVLSTVPVAWLFVSGIDRLQPRLRGRAMAAALCVYAAVSTATVFASPQEGLFTIRHSLIGFQRTADDLVALTPAKSLVVVDRADKFLFPLRRVIVPLRSEDTYRTISKLRNQLPIYYFGITFPDADLDYLNQLKLPPLGLGIEPVKTVGDETLYKFVVKNP